MSGTHNDVWLDWNSIPCCVTIVMHVMDCFGLMKRESDYVMRCVMMAE